MKTLMTSDTHRFRRGFSLLELLATVTLMGIVAAIAVPRLSGHTKDTKINACHVYRGNIEVQAELWFRNRETWPAGDLSDIGQTDRYFPDGLPRCPVDDSRYTLSEATGRVIGHDHAE